MGLGLYTTVSSRVVPGTGAPGCTGVRLHAVGYNVDRYTATAVVATVVVGHHSRSRGPLKAP